MTPNPLLILILPLIAQLFLAQKAIAKRIHLKFSQISLINLTLQLLVSYWAWNLVADNLRNSEGVIKCALPLVAVVFFELLLIIVLLIIILIQYLIKRHVGKKKQLSS